MHFTNMKPVMAMAVQRGWHGVAVSSRLSCVAPTSLRLPASGVLRRTQQQQLQRGAGARLDRSSAAGNSSSSSRTTASSSADNSGSKKLNPKQLSQRRRFLQEQLGMAPEQADAVLKNPKNRAASISVATFRSRVQELLKYWVEDQGGDKHAGKTAACKLLERCPEILAVQPRVWQCVLKVLQMKGVPDPLEAVMQTPRLLSRDIFAPVRAACRLLLQRCFHLSASQVYQAPYAGYAMDTWPDRLASRLFYLDRKGLRPLLVLDKGAAKHHWRQQRGLPASKAAAGEPAYISLCDVCKSSDTDFASLVRLALLQAGADAVGHGGSTKGSSIDAILKELNAFRTGLQQMPAWHQLLADAQKELRRLKEQLPPHLHPT